MVQSPVLAPIIWFIGSWSLSRPVYAATQRASVDAVRVDRLEPGFRSSATSLPIGLWDEWEGMDVQAGSSFNMQFDRKPNP